LETIRLGNDPTWSYAMNYTIAGADRATHVRIVFVTLLAATALAWIGIALS
jgi:hypothetical protein